MFRFEALASPWMLTLIGRTSSNSPATEEEGVWWGGKATLQHTFIVLNGR